MLARRAHTTVPELRVFERGSPGFLRMRQDAWLVACSQFVRRVGADARKKLLYCHAGPFEATVNT